MRAIAVITSAVVLTVSFSGCAGSNIKKDNDEHSFSDMKVDSELAYNTKGEFSVNLSVDNIRLNDNIDASDVKVFYSDIDSDKLSDIDASEAVKLNNDEYKSVYAEISAVTANSEHSVTVSFTDDSFSKNKPDCFFAVFDKSTNTSDRYLISMIPIRYSAYSLVSDTTQIRSESKSNRFNLTLDKSSFANEVTADDIVLSGGFESCNVSEIEKVGDNSLSLVISAENGYKTGDDGCITIKQSAITDACVDVSATVGIVSPSVVFSSTDFEASTNYARITFSLIDCSFGDSVSAAMFECDNDNVEITRFDRVTANEGVLYLSFDTETPAKAIELISSCTFGIKDSALNINYPLYFNVLPKAPDVSAIITSVEEDGSSSFKVTAQFSVVDGSFNVISKSSFIFSGDYSKAVITSITAQDSSATVCFDIPKTSSVQNAELYGTVGLKSGAVISRWGTQTNISSFPLYYSYAENADDKLNYVDNDKLSEMCDILGKYLSSVEVGNTAGIDNLSAYKTDGSTFGELYTELADKYGDVHVLIRKADELLKSEHISANVQNTESVFTVNRYMNDIKSLHSLIKPVSDSMARLFTVYESMNNTEDKQELEALASEAKELIGKITSVYSTKIKGVSYSALLDRVVSGYCGGALTAFDSICDDIYNWYPQSTADKKIFRSMSQSIIVNAVLVQYISVVGEEDKASDFALMRDDIIKLADYSDANAVNDNGTKNIYCTTLDRSFKLEKVNSVLHNAVNEISISEISQLENLLQKGSTVENELAEVGFNVSSVRYIVCSDSNITGRSQTEQGRHRYSFVRRATLYDLTASQTVNEMEYCNYYYSIEIDDNGNPVAVPYVNVYYQLYTLR